MIECKSARQIEKMRYAGRIVAGALRLARELARIGVTTDYLNTELERYVYEHHGVPIFKGYRGYPKSICTSINEEVVHGIPGQRRLKSGDILSIDIGVGYKKYIADAAITLPIGEVLPEARRLIEVCQRALQEVIEVIEPGIRLSEVSACIQRCAERNGYSVIRDYSGHGIGRYMHEEPEVPNYISEALLANDAILVEGLALAIEPMICMGRPETETLANKWTVVTKDRKLSAHFEHTVVVTEDGHDVLTLE